MLEVIDAVVIVDDLFGRWVVEKRVDGEVASRGILRMRSKFIVAQDSAMTVGGLLFGCRCPKGGGFNDLLTKDDMDKLKTSSNDARASEQWTDLFGRCIGGDVKVFGLESNDEVPYGTTHDIGLIAFVL